MEYSLGSIEQIYWRLHSKAIQLTVYDSILLSISFPY